MGRKALWTVVGLAVVTVAVAVAQVDFRRGHGWCGNGWHRGGPLGYAAHELKLSDAQVSQVRSIWMEERPTITALLNDLISGAHQLADSTADGKFDESKLQTTAAAEGNTFAKLLIERAFHIARLYHRPERRAASVRRQAAAALAGQDGPCHHAVGKAKPVVWRTEFTEQVQPCVTLFR